MVAQLIAASIRHRLLVLVATVALMFFGARAFNALPIDAVPDLTNVQVQILTSAPALAPVDVERLVSAPIELAMTGIPGVTEIRSISRFGTSAVTVVFADHVDPYFARQLVHERMSRARADVPVEYGTPELGPMSTGLGEIYQFEVRGGGKTPMELRTILDWQIAPRLRMVSGVVEVNAFGGELKTYEVTVDPDRLLAFGLSLSDVFNALSRNNRSTGGGAILRGPEGILVRGDALIGSLEDLANVVVATDHGVPIYVHQLGQVRLAPMLRQGATTRDGHGEIVAGMAMMLLGENSRHVAQAVEAEMQRIRPTLPPGVTVTPFYDRTGLVNQTIHTVAKNLVEGAALVIVVLVLVLRNLRAGLIAATMIPLAMMFAFLGMRAAGVSGNLMSLGAIDFGLVVDGAIILLENAIHHLAEARERLGRELRPAERDETVLKAALEVRGATAFGEVMIALVYLPILTLEGVEGKMFRPMALTVVFALAGAFILSLTFVPALASWLLSRKTVDHPGVGAAGVQRFYGRLLSWTLKRPILTGLLALGTFGGSVGLALRLGSEFVPRLDEGAIVVEVTRLPGTSLEESLRQSAIMERVVAAFPEVRTVVAKTGRPEIANDPMGVESTDLYVILKPRDEWPGSTDHEALIARMEEALRRAMPGVGLGFSQPIEMRMNELVSGVRSDVAVKIYGEDFATLARLGDRIGQRLATLRGAEDLKIDRVEGMPVLRASVDRTAVARFGATADDVLAAIETIGGRTVGEVLEGRRRFPLRVRLAPGRRDDLETLARLPVRSGDGFSPLADLATLAIEDEPLVINRDGTERRLTVQVNVRGRDLGSFADEAQAVVAKEIHLPAGVHLAWGGQFENLRRARARLLIVVPIALVLIVILLYVSFRATLPAALILANVPFAATGGVLALVARGLALSISAGVGFVALFGIAVLNGLVLITQIRQLRVAGATARDAVYEGSLRRLRPVLTTALVASLGFVPMALAQGAGAEVQRPLATVVIGGVLTSTLLTLAVLPALYLWLAKRDDLSGETDQ